MDMSKAFDTVNKETPVEDLRTTMDPDELYMIKVLLEGVQLCVRRGRETGERFTTNIGVPGGDCLSPVLFILYPAKAFSYQPELNDPNYHLTSPEPPQASTHAHYADGTEWAVMGADR